MKHIQKFNEEFFKGSDAIDFKVEVESALNELRDNLDKAIELLEVQSKTGEAHQGVLQDFLTKTLDYNTTVKSIIGPQ